MQKTYNSVCLAAIGAVALTTASASAASAKQGTTVYGGHTYELWSSYDIAWDTAVTEAQAAGGYLAVLTTQAETEAVYGAFKGTDFFQELDGQAYSAYLGGYAIDGDGNRIMSTTDPTAWAWVTGEAWTAFDSGNFGGVEPNGDSEGLSINRFGNSLFNDESGLVGGYIVEKNGVPDSGSTLALLGGAFTLLGALSRRIRQ